MKICSEPFYGFYSILHTPCLIYILRPLGYGLSTVQFHHLACAWKVTPDFPIVPLLTNSVGTLITKTFSRIVVE